ncbi:hypothetical protein H4R18_000103 [Coemansia javaensis]|uniref:Uncharacterized protein n=1 Tax=Coemansia javaensis TaxID=2761396 RepID=A0A9W8HNJ4_9FUNG|nr:hypothetical protein H4R18_000103 [Coemansia javaensis]
MPSSSISIVRFAARSLRSTSGASSAAARRFYSLPHASSNSADPHQRHFRTQQELLDAKHPANPDEALAAVIDGELDYDTDMTAAAVNNAEAELRAEQAAKAKKIAKDTADDFSKNNYL